MILMTFEPPPALQRQAHVHRGDLPEQHARDAELRRLQPQLGQGVRLRGQGRAAAAGPAPSCTCWPGTTNSPGNPRVVDPRNWKGWGNRSIDDMFYHLPRMIFLTEEQFEAEVAARETPPLFAGDAGPAVAAPGSGTVDGGGWSWRSAERCRSGAALRRRALRDRCCGCQRPDHHLLAGPERCAGVRGVGAEPRRHVQPVVRVHEPEHGREAARSGRPAQPAGARPARRADSPPGSSPGATGTSSRSRCRPTSATARSSGA